MQRLFAVFAVAVAVALPAFAAEEPAAAAPAPTPTPAPMPEVPSGLVNAERLFPQGVSPVTNNTLFYSNTGGRASNAGGSAFRLSERIDVAPITHLTLSVGMEYRSNGQLNPEVTAKYQLFDQQGLGFNGAAALKYKLVGLNPSGSELEGTLAASRSIGPVVVMLNGVLGRGLVDPDMDAEMVLGVGLPVLGSGFVGLNGQAKFFLGEAAEQIVLQGGRPSELLGGLVLAYRFSFVEASVLGGYLSPSGTTPSGPMALGKVGLSF